MSPVQSYPHSRLLLLLVIVTLGVVRSSRLPAEVGSQPHSISLRRNGAHVCGGALIREKWVLTAAHCVSLGGGQQSYPAPSYNVRAGSIQRLAGGQLVPLSKIIIHTNYSSSDALGSNDLALLELQSPVVQNANTRPIDLATERPAAGSQVTFSGWGSSQLDGSLSHGLQVATRQSLSASDCQKELFLQQEDLLCLSPVAEDFAGLCSGDAGAPASYNNQLVGIAAFFVSGCGSDQPDGYVDVTQHLEWINENAV
ncbi:serine protease SP24D [Drosophila sechellia]|uniref:trypsin n=1 Tax=Drosophila sechellia TaxID=7238 RepID=B4IER9_DROSE|nr:serine protease SP24D [Drosophila sechellia]EDW46173.1 GM13457 [Drosophila sechellia]